MRYTARWRIDGVCGRTLYAGDVFRTSNKRARQVLWEGYGGSVENAEDAAAIPSSVMARFLLVLGWFGILAARGCWRWSITKRSASKETRESNK